MSGGSYTYRVDRAIDEPKGGVVILCGWRVNEGWRKKDAAQINEVVAHKRSRRRS